MDFFNLLQHEISMKILMCLEDPSDLIRLTCVSHSSRHFVIKNGVCKQLCLRKFPQLAKVDCVIECMEKPTDVGSINVNELETLEREHRVYTFLALCFSIELCSGDCIDYPICASTTDTGKDVENTLESKDIYEDRASYWSSKGQHDPALPETLTYKLTDDLCVISEINIKLFQAYFEPHQPIYSANAVRFRMGHLKSPLDESGQKDSYDDKFVWTYMSQEFPMAQENWLQNFKFPEPVLCIGGILQIELLGRVQRKAKDGLFYICVSHVQVLGNSLYHAFDVETLESSEKFVLKALRYDLTQLFEDFFHPRCFRLLGDEWEEIMNGCLRMEDLMLDESDDDPDPENNGAALQVPREMSKGGTAGGFPHLWLERWEETFPKSTLHWEVVLWGWGGVDFGSTFLKSTSHW